MESQPVNELPPLGRHFVLFADFRSLCDPEPKRWAVYVRMKESEESQHSNGMTAWRTPQRHASWEGRWEHPDRINIQQIRLVEP